MFSPKAINILNLALLVSAAPSKRQSTGSGTCTDLHIFLARGWNEGYPGRQQHLVDAACNGVASCDYEDITFDATNANGFDAAVEEGRSSGVAQVQAYTQRCPDAKIVLSGYSEGAVVVNNVLADSGLTPTSAPGNKVCAGLVFGDPNHVANQPYNVQAGSSYNSQSPRSGASLEHLNAFSSLLRSYCNGGDSLCAYGDGSRPMEDGAHTNYFDLYSGDAGNFIQDKCVGGSSGGGGGGGSTTPPSTGNVCVAGKVKAGLSENYTGLCSFACSNGYCPDGVCECTQYGTQAGSGDGVGQDGCPANGLDDSYKGLCSFSCSHGYCPTGACRHC
ncbi:cutinase [Diaporthe helianthi]|uniref:Cutinase n=1 Tax=Diaporthe helianthi TaxID=158607 RepID=A0A2P5HV20_DIAHE|nr:cutinase [Diaporthe helianthi]